MKRGGGGEGHLLRVSKKGATPCPYALGHRASRFAVCDFEFAGGIIGSATGCHALMARNISLEKLGIEEVLEVSE